ncbi:MAG: hypothetical protein KBD29_00835 [Candidatus Magasanikbacteria bacterium]|nr:hypothetical protein [Candidatus Magasanikbacteria bacterium]
MSDFQYDTIKTAILDHVRETFEEIEDGLARSHEEKYALLEDALENASDVDELKVAFEQWFADHSDELQLEYELDEMWAHAVARVEDTE